MPGLLHRFEETRKYTSLLCSWDYQCFQSSVYGNQILKSDFVAFLAFILKHSCCSVMQAVYGQIQKKIIGINTDILYRTVHLPYFSIHSWKIDSKYLQLFLLHVNAKIGSANRKTVYKCRLIFTFWWPSKMLYKQKTKPQEEIQSTFHLRPQKRWSSHFDTAGFTGTTFLSWWDSKVTHFWKCVALRCSK